MRISLSSLSVCTSASSCSRSSSITSPGSSARIRTSARRPESMLTSPVNSPGPCSATSVSVVPGRPHNLRLTFRHHEERHDMRARFHQHFATLHATHRPCGQMRAICAAVSVGKICSRREAVSGGVTSLIISTHSSCVSDFLRPICETSVTSDRGCKPGLQSIQECPCVDCTSWGRRSFS